MFHIKYPNVNDEILNLDWLLAKVQEMDKKLASLIEGGFEDLLDQYFNSVMIDAIYHEDLEQIELKRELIVGDGLHVYNAGEQSMTIDE